MFKVMDLPATHVVIALCICGIGDWVRRRSVFDSGSPVSEKRLADGEAVADFQPSGLWKSSCRTVQQNIATSRYPMLSWNSASKGSAVRGQRTGQIPEAKGCKKKMAGKNEGHETDRD